MSKTSQEVRRQLFVMRVIDYLIVELQKIDGIVSFEHKQNAEQKIQKEVVKQGMDIDLTLPEISQDSQEPNKQIPSVLSKIGGVKSQIQQNVIGDSDSDGWGEVAKRIGVNIGEIQKPKEETKLEKSTKFKLNLSILKPKDKDEQVQIPQADNSLKMHLLFGQKSSFERTNKQEEQDNQEYLTQNEGIVVNEDLHVTMILTIMQLIIDPQTQTFDTRYVTQFPANNNMLNIPVILHKHMNRVQNQKVIETIMSMKLSQAQQRLLRLLCLSKFNPDIYNIHECNLIAKGAFGQIYSGFVKLHDNSRMSKYQVPIAIKIQPIHLNLNDRCVLHDVYNEITILDKLQQSTNFCQLFDYGVSDQGYIMIMKKYLCSFKLTRSYLFKYDAEINYSNQQRKMIKYGHEYSLSQYTRVLLLTYIKFLQIIKEMHQKKVIHFDLKSDNVFISPASIEWVSMNKNYTQKEFYDEIFQRYKNIQNENQLPYLMTFGDFGESIVFTESEQTTMLSKGTEFNKSPEMLVNTNQQYQSNFNRRRQKGAGIESDVWSAACTLYEILTGDYLFYDADWIRFFLRVTNNQLNDQSKYAKDCKTFSSLAHLQTCVRGIKLIPEKRAMLGNNTSLIDLLEFQLVQDPSKRPSIDDCITMTRHVLQTYFPVTKNYELDFDFSILGSQTECMMNPAEILSIPTQQPVQQLGPRIIQSLHQPQCLPLDLLQNGTIFLGSHDLASNSDFINQHNIQTVIDCTTTCQSQKTFVARVVRPNAKLIQLFKQSKQSKHQNLKEIILTLEHMFDAIRSTLTLNGCVLIQDESGAGVASNLALSCLMEFESLFLYQGVAHIKRMLPSAHLNSNFLEVLQYWSDRRLKVGIKFISLFPDLKSQADFEDPYIYSFISSRVALANYRCACGRVFFVVKPGAITEYCVCNCVVSDEYAKTRDKQSEGGKIRDCPSTSCRTILNYYNSLYGMRLHKLLWLYLKDDDIVSNWKRSTENVAVISNYQAAEHSNIQFRAIDDIRAPLFRIPLKDEWRLNYCTICGAPTHYEKRSKDKYEICILAILSNK
ncbi:Kinase [Hexamita inflata]|uniref:Kinase n=1 Tax=Hexamita inflata TaxID=28002 RepID=A0ABP1HZB3_9EUKA